MCSFRAIENPNYGICLNSCSCEVFNKRYSTYKLIESGCLAKFQYRNLKQNCSVLTLRANKNEVYVREFLQYIFIDLEIFKYLNAINNPEERLEFFTNDERREFVLHLEKDSIVSVGFSRGKQTKALFHGIYEKRDKIFIVVELLEATPRNIIKNLEFVSESYWINRFKFSLPASLIRKPAFSDIVQKTHVNLPKKYTISQTPVARHENYHEAHNNQTINRSYNKPSNSEPKNNFPRKTVERNAKRYENRSETQVGSVLIVPTRSSTDTITNSKFCYECSNVREGSICLFCVNETKKMFGQINCKINVETPITPPEINTHHNLFDKNSKLCRECLHVYEGNICLSCETKKISGQNNYQTKVDSSISLDTSLSSGTPIIPLETNTHVSNEDYLPYTSKVAVRHNTTASNCIICNNHLNKSEGFFFILCKHTFCETCIKKQINLEALAHTNILPCCDRQIELDEIKYFLFNTEYEQFKSSSKQQCFNKNCSGYDIMEKRVEESSITFKCNKCELENCLKCKTIHVNLTCEQYEKITNSVDKETAEKFLTWIREGIAMPCPKCEALIEKDEGCDWVQCPFCKTEICWATRGPRWGAEGKGDKSGGCGCDFKVKKCVENCNYCH